MTRASSAASTASTPAPCFAPNPPPMYSEITRTCSGARSNRRASSRRASNIPWVETHAVSESPSQRATAAWGSSGDCTWAGVSKVSSTRVSAADSAASGSPRTVSRGSSVKRCSVSPASSASGDSGSKAAASASMPAAAASGVSPATIAIGSPAHAGSSVRGLSPAIVSGPSGPTTARTPAVARAASRSSPVTLHRAKGARRTWAWSIPGSWTSTVKRAAPLVRTGPSWRVVGEPTTSSSASSGQLSTSSSSSTSTQTSSKRPSISRCDLTRRGFMRPPGRRHAGSRARSSGRRRSGRCCRPSPRGSRRGSAVRPPRAARSPRRSGPACRTRTGARPR